MGRITARKRITRITLGDPGAESTVSRREDVLAVVARPDRLIDLVETVGADPAAIGPAQRQVLASLRAIAELPVYPQGNEVAALLELVRGADRVTPAFRDAAVPVLVPMLR